VEVGHFVVSESRSRSGSGFCYRDEHWTWEGSGKTALRPKENRIHPNNISVYYLNTYVEDNGMPRIAVEDTPRMSLRIRAEEKALLMRAVALKHTDLTDFVLHHALRAAKAVIERAESVQLSERDSLRVLDLLENPPKPNAKLLAAARALPKRS
jgi:uncharacterized protein (DUF1778 family)